MHKGKSMFLTILCMGVILGFGYLLIMERAAVPPAKMKEIIAKLF